jgi:hypothetical protein
MIRTLLLAALVTLSAIPLALATSTDDPVCVLGDNGICGGVWSSNVGTCAGAGFGLQGAGYCTNNANPLCGFVFVGFNRVNACGVVYLP